MTKDSFQWQSERWSDLAEAVETAARFRKYFPRDGLGGLTSGELQLLAAIAVWPNLTPGQLAVCLELEKNSVSKPLGELERAGLIVADTGAEDGRSKTISLTLAGSNKVAQLQDRIVHLELGSVPQE